MPSHGPTRYLLTTLYVIIETAIIIVDAHTPPISVEEYGSLVWWALGGAECYTACGGGHRFPAKAVAMACYLYLGLFHKLGMSL